MKIDFDELIKEKLVKQSYKKELEAEFPNAKLVPCGHGEYLVTREMTDDEKKRFRELTNEQRTD